MEIAIKDETLSGVSYEVMSLYFKTELVSIREIITQRVLKEVGAYNQKLDGVFSGLVQPADAEKVLNAYQVKPKKPIDGKRQVEIALDAFQRNVFFVLVDDKQFEHLEDEIIVANTTSISFIKLTPLVGG